MVLETLAACYPAKDWAQGTGFARALPRSLRLPLGRVTGGLGAAGDRASPFGPTRLGLAVRPYEPGDPPRTLCVPSYARTQSLLTKVDRAPGRAQVEVVIATGPSMEFSSTSVHKGQVALAAAALAELGHGRGLRHVRTGFLQGSLGAQTLAAWERRLRRAHLVYLIADFLPQGEDWRAGTDELTALLLGSPWCSKTVVVVVRDPLEWTDLSPHPLGSPQELRWDDGPPRYGGPAYLGSLADQGRVLARTLGPQCRGLAVLTLQTPLFTAAGLLNSLARERQWSGS